MRSDMRRTWPWVGSDWAELLTQVPAAHVPVTLLGWRFDHMMVAKARRHGRWLHAGCEVLRRAGTDFGLPIHDAPYPPCSCGFYVYKKPRWWWFLVPFYRVRVVELRGRVVEHEHGWRAAQIRYLPRRH